MTGAGLLSASTGSESSEAFFQRDRFEDRGQNHRFDVEWCRLNPLGPLHCLASLNGLPPRGANPSFLRAAPPQMLLPLPAGRPAAPPDGCPPPPAAPQNPVAAFA